MDEEENNTIHRWIEICYQEDLKRVEKGQGSASEDDEAFQIILLIYCSLNTFCAKLESVPLGSVFKLPGRKQILYYQ